MGLSQIGIGIAQLETARIQYQLRASPDAEWSPLCGRTRCVAQIASACRWKYQRPTGSQARRRRAASGTGIFRSRAIATVSRGAGCLASSVLPCRASLGGFRQVLRLCASGLELAPSKWVSPREDNVRIFSPGQLKTQPGLFSWARKCGHSGALRLRLCPHRAYLCCDVSIA